LPRAKIIKTYSHKIDNLGIHHLDKNIPLVPGTVPPLENQNILGSHHHHNHLKRRN